MKIVILIPHGARTGGPEALHQLSDAMLHNSVNCIVWYVLPSDIETLKRLHGNNLLRQGLVLDLGDRYCIVSEYEKYKARIENKISLDDDTIFIIPEVYVELTVLLANFRMVLWWLSVDNTFNYIGALNLNHLRRQRLWHACQSKYAYNFTQQLGLPNTTMLSDYTPLEDFYEYSTKTIISISGLPKVVFDVESISKNITEESGLPVKIVRGMSRSEVYSVLNESLVYVDLGSFPGKDRLPREALLRNCCVIATDAGAAREFLLPDELYCPVGEIEFLVNKIVRLSKSCDLYRSELETAKSAIKREKEIFFSEVCSLISKLKN